MQGKTHTKIGRIRFRKTSMLGTWNFWWYMGLINQGPPFFRDSQHFPDVFQRAGGRYLQSRPELTSTPVVVEVQSLEPKKNHWQLEFSLFFGGVHWFTRWWFQTFKKHPFLGEMIQFWINIFQLGWNHQPDSGLRNILQRLPTFFGRLNHSSVFFVALWPFF